VICVLYYWARERLILEPGRHLRKLGRLREAVEAANGALRGDSSETQGCQDILPFPQLKAIIVKIRDFCHGFFALLFGVVKAYRCGCCAVSSKRMDQGISGGAGFCLTAGRQVAMNLPRESMNQLRGNTSRVFGAPHN
jgi:hypothetical protein